MANALWITHYSGTGREGMQVAQARRGQKRETLTIATELKSVVFGSNTYAVRLKAVGADCIYIISDPDVNGNYETASTTVGDYLSSGDLEYVGVKPFQCLSVISSTGS